jgi:hypothetical protein
MSADGHPHPDPQLVAALVEAIRQTQPVQHCLSDEEQEWVRVSIAAQARRVKFRDAVIEKSMTSLVWSAIVGVGYIFLEYVRSRGFKP